MVLKMQLKTCSNIAQSLMGYDDKTDCLCQKWTLLAIWVAYTYLSPVISIAPSSYILFQNIVNSWQLWQRETGRL